MTREAMLKILNDRQNRENHFTNISEQTITDAIKNEEETTMAQITYIVKNRRYYKIENGKTTRIGKAEYEAAQQTTESNNVPEPENAEIRSRPADHRI